MLQFGTFKQIQSLKPFGRACKSAGIINLRFHDLRHEATSLLFEKGLNIMEASSVTYHTDLKRLKRCTHLKVEYFVDNLQ